MLLLGGSLNYFHDLHLHPFFSLHYHVLIKTLIKRKLRMKLMPFMSFFFKALKILMLRDFFCCYCYKQSVA